MPAYTPTAVAAAIVTKIADNLANAASPGPWPNLQNAVVSTLPLKATIDGYLSGLDFKAQSDAMGLGAVTTALNTFADVGNGSSTGYTTWTVNVPLTKTYMFTADLSFTSSIGSGRISFQVVVDGVAPAGQPAFGMSQYYDTAQRNRLAFRLPLALTEGSRVIKLQWKTDTAVTAGVGTEDLRCFTLTG